METENPGQSSWSRLVAQWQPAVLVAVCVAGGLTLTTMVIGSTPDFVVRASEESIEAAPLDAPASDAPTVTESPVDTGPLTAELVDPAVADAPDPGTATAPPQPAAAVPVPGPAPTAAPTTPTTPPPAPVVTTAAPAPVSVAAPRATAPPTTAAPAPTTAAPPPTTAAPATATLTYPSYAAGSAGTVVLQFDGSSIYVASVAREPNWVAQVDRNGPRTVEIKFFNTATGRDEEFHATVEGGRIKVEN